MDRELPGWIYGALSLPRLAPYLRAANGDSGVAMRLYWWNIEVYGALYGPLHCLEVGLRNALHERLEEHLGRAEWWAAAPLTAAGSRMVADVVDKLRNRGAVHVSADDVVAGLSFGFWVALLSRGAAYDRSFWVPALHKAFPGYSGSRARLHEGLLTMVLLRNRIMHHEPVHHRDLAADHRKLYRILGYLSVELLLAAKEFDRVPEVLARRVSVCEGSHPPRF